jgi:hypothetical protein
MMTSFSGYGLWDIGDELRVDERRNGVEEMPGDKKLNGSWDVMAGTATGSTMVVAWLGLAWQIAQPHARRRWVGLVWPKREESPRAAHRLRRMAALLQDSDDQQWKMTWRRGSWAAMEG